MKRKFRLRKRTDFERVRRHGKSYAHPLVVLVARPNELALTRVGVAAGRSLGNAVERNRAKRRLRAAVHPFAASIPPGCDILFLARAPLAQASFDELTLALRSLLSRAKVLPPPTPSHDS